MQETITLSGSGSLNEEFLISLERLIREYKMKADSIPKIPVSVFSGNELGILEAAVKFLREEHSMRYSEIGSFLNRDARTIWAVYHNSIKKNNKRFSYNDAEKHVPCIIFKDRSMSPLESIAVYLKDKDTMALSQIASGLDRSYRSVWHAYRNGVKKGGVNRNGEKSR